MSKPKSSKNYPKYAAWIAGIMLLLTIGKIWGETNCARTEVKYDEIEVSLKQLQDENSKLNDSLTRVILEADKLKSELRELDSIIYVDNRKFYVQDFGIKLKGNSFGKYEFEVTGNLSEPAPRDIQVRFQLIQKQESNSGERIIYTGSIDKIREGETFFEFYERVDEYLDGKYILRFRFESYKIERTLYL